MHFSVIKDLRHVLTLLTISDRHSLLSPYLDICDSQVLCLQDVEILITAVFELGEVQSVALQETGCGPLAQLVLPLIRTEIPNSNHQIVSSAVLELYLRCHKVPLHNQQDLPSVISTFIGDRGIRHPAEVKNHE